jgi:hypothetical protein
LAKLVRHALDHLVLAIEEREPARLRLLDDRHLDARHARQALALVVVLAVARDSASNDIFDERFQNVSR